MPALGELPDHCLTSQFGRLYPDRESSMFTGIAIGPKRDVSRYKRFLKSEPCGSVVRALGTYTVSLTSQLMREVYIDHTIQQCRGVSPIAIWAPPHQREDYYLLINSNYVTKVFQSTHPYSKSYASLTLVSAVAKTTKITVYNRKSPQDPIVQIYFYFFKIN